MKYFTIVILLLITHFAVAVPINDSIAQNLRRSKYQRVIPKLEFEDADLQTVLLALSEYSGIDIVSAVKGKLSVTITLRNKSWQEALNIICKIYKLTPVVSDGYIYVMPTSEYKQMLLDEAQKDEQLKEVEPLKMKIIKVNNSKASEMNNAIKDLLSKRGKTSVVEKTNSILIVDTEAKIRQIEKVISKLDKQTPQVLIEAKLVTVDKTRANELGVQWSILTTDQNSSPIANIESNPGTGDPMISVSNANGTTFDIAPGGFKIGTLTGVNLQYMFRKLDAEVVATPQITTLDNKEAEIFMGEKVPVRTIDAEGKATYQLVEAGTKLKVKPHITEDGKILMELEPTKKSYYVDPQLQSPIFNEQSAKTEAIVDDGETIVIGGLSTKDENIVQKGVPVLSDIPILGALFRYKKKETKYKDLIIFVTPHIIKNLAQEDTLRTEEIGGIK